MAYAAGELKVLVIADTSKVAGQISTGTKAAGEKAGKAAGASWGKNFLSTVGTAMAVVGAEKLFSGMISGAEEAQKVNKATEAVIRSTGGAAHVTAAQVTALGDSLLKKTGIDDEAIKSGANMLLTFTNVRNEVGKGNDIFNQSTSVLTDMTAAMNGGNVTQENMRTTAIQLGKALNDPIKGMGALRRVGVTFTDQQKEQIKTMVASGNTMGAQKVILAELGKEFGGAAASYATPMQRMKTAAGELSETMGTALLPVIESTATWMTNVGIPALQSFGGWLARNKAWVIPLAASVATFAGTLYTISKALQVATMAARLFGLTLTVGLGPVSAIIAALAALGVGLYLLWTRSRTFRVIVEAAFYGVKNAALAVVGWFSGPFTRFFAVTIPGIFRSVLNWVKANWPLIVGLLTGPVGLAVAETIKHWTAIRNFITNTIRAVLGAVSRGAGAISSAVVNGWNAVWSNTTRIWGQITGAVSRALRGIISLATSIGGQVIGGLMSGIRSAMSGIGGWVKGVIVDPIIGAVKSFFGIHSPATIMLPIGINLIRGIIVGMLHADIGGLITRVFGGFPHALAAIVGRGLVAVSALPKKALGAIKSVGGAAAALISGTLKKLGGYIGFASGGVIPEPVTGFGHRTGQVYRFAERGPELVSPLTGPAPGLAGLGRAGTVIHVYPSAGMDERALAAMVDRELAWSAAGGAP